MELLSQSEAMDAEKSASVFYEGLRPDLKAAAAYKCEAIVEYNQLKSDIRIIT